MTNFPRNRYSSDEFVRGFDASQIGDDCGDICISFETSHELSDEFTIYFPTCVQQPKPEILGLARKACSNITELDNLVQESCELEHKRNGHLPRDYDLYLAFAEIEPNLVKLEYYGTHVNTQWAAHFSPLPDGSWDKINF